VGPEGVVYAVDKDPGAVELTRRNAERFGVGNRVVVIHGEAPGVLSSIRNIDVAFVGGGSERIEEIMRALVNVLSANGRVVLDAILIETVSRALGVLVELGFVNIEVTEVVVAKGMRTRVGTAMIARNPVFIVSAEKSPG
jgi:cobalt-precorrin-6B (C15)-methyltransferase